MTDNDLIVLKPGDKIVYYKPFPDSYDSGHWTYKPMRYEVRVMAIVEGYAMLRRKGCVPFIESIKDLTKWLEKTDA